MCGESRVAIKGPGSDSNNRYSLHGFLKWLLYGFLMCSIRFLVTRSSINTHEACLLARKSHSCVSK
jgi:hypothetical protein